MTRLDLRRLGALALTFVLVAPLGAQVPETLNYQGRLLQNTEDQDAVTGSVDIIFSLWTDLSGGTELWSETWNDVALSDGVFSVLLGSNGSPLTPDLFQADTTLFLQLEVDGETLDPRQQLGTSPFAFVDDPENELQDLVLDGDTLGMTDSATTIDLGPYLDDTDEQDLSLAGNTLSLSNDPTPVDLSPYLDDTDDQTLSLAGTTLGISDSGSTVDLSGFLDNTDVQTLALTEDILTISGSGSSIDLSTASSITQILELAESLGVMRKVFVSSQVYAGDFGGLSGADAECQSLASAAGLEGVYQAWLSDSTGSPSNRFDRLGSFELVDGTPVADSYSDLTDGTLDNGIDITETGATLGGPNRAVWTATSTSGTPQGDDCSDWSVADASSAVVGTFGLADSFWTDGGTATCADTARLYCFQRSTVFNTDDQMLTLAGTDLRLSSDDGTDTISLAAFLDNTDDQTLALSGNTLSIENGNSVDLSKYLDDTDTDDQTLALSGSTLSIVDGNSVDLSSVGMDDQTLSLAANNLSIEDGNSVDLSGYLDDTDDQTLALSGSNLSITDGNSVNLSGIDTDTDEQTLSLSGTNLSIQNGNTVSLSGFLDNTDSQDINNVLARGNDANNRDLTNLDDVDIDKLTIDDDFECDAETANCIESSHIERDTILGNDITDRIFILHIDCNGGCSQMSLREACDVIENLRGIDFEVELMDVSCVHDIPSTSGNQFVPCSDGTTTFSDYECRAFELRTLGDIPCVGGDGTDALVTCYQTDIAK